MNNQVGLSLLHVMCFFHSGSACLYGPENEGARSLQLARQKPPAGEFATDVVVFWLLS